VDVYSEHEEKNHENGHHSPVRASQQQQKCQPSLQEKEEQHNRRAPTNTEPQHHHHHHLHKEEMDLEEQEPLPAVREWLSGRHCGDMQRSFTFPREVAVEDVKAKLRSGLLMMLNSKVHKTESSKKVAILSED